MSSAPAPPAATTLYRWTKLDEVELIFRQADDRSSSRRRTSSMRCFALATLTLRSPLSVRPSQPATQRSSNSADNSASGSESR